jgi:hypothetical protein
VEPVQHFDDPFAVDDVAFFYILNWDPHGLTSFPGCRIWGSGELFLIGFTSLFVDGGVSYLSDPGNKFVGFFQDRQRF